MPRLHRWARKLSARTLIPAISVAVVIGVEFAADAVVRWANAAALQFRFPMVPALSECPGIGHHSVISPWPSRSHDFFGPGSGNLKSTR
jgi:hypothetical protein